MRAKRKVLLGAGLVTACGAGAFAYTVLSTKVVSDTAGIRFRSYRQIENALVQGEKPEAWDAAVFVEPGLTRRVLEAVESRPFNIGREEGKPEVEVSLAAATLTWDVGAIDAKIAIQGKHLGTNVHFDAEVDAVFVVENIEPDPRHPDGVLIVIEPRVTAIRPGLGWPTAMLRTSSSLSNLIGMGITAKLRDRLKLSVPLRRSFSYSTGIDRSFDVPVDGKTKVTVKVSSPGEKLVINLIYRPIITPTGLWALAKVAKPGETETGLDNDERITEDQGAGLDAMRSRLAAKLSGYVARHNDVAIHVSSSLFGKLAGIFNELDPAKRVVGIHSTAVSGNLFESRWQADGLGEGGVFVVLTNPGAVSATISADHLSSAWDPTKGSETLTLPIRVAATADIHLHVDPLISGGVGTSVGMKGSGTANVQASASFQELSLGSDSGVFLIPDLPCQAPRLGIQTDGRLVLGPLKTDVPPIGANFSMVLGKEPLKPIPIVSSLPYFVPFDPKMTALLPNIPDPPGFHPFPTGLRIQFSNYIIQSAADGVWIATDVTATPTREEAADPPSVKADRLATAAQDVLAKTRPACNLTTKAEMVVGNIAIGQNNDLIKAASTVGKAFEDMTRGLLEAAKKALDAWSRSDANPWNVGRWRW